MKVIDVYEQYFAAECTFSDVPRHAAVIKLTATSDAGTITYEVGVSFFPHNDPEDFGISYDAYGSEVLFSDRGRRSAKRDEQYLQEVQKTADRIAGRLNGTIFWDRPLIEARRG